MIEDLDNDIAKFNSIIELNKAITFFGSARLKPKSLYYEKAKQLAFECVRAGFTVVSGGGGGLMQAANEGAFMAAKDMKGLSKQEKEQRSTGFNILLPFEQQGNNFLGYNITFKNLAVRKMALIEKSLAFVIFPGGFGTLDEFIEVLTLKQLNFKNVPIYAVGVEFWSGLDEFIRSSLLGLELISKGDELLYELSDDLDDILEKLKENL